MHPRRSEYFVDLWVADLSELGVIPRSAVDLLDEADRRELGIRAPGDQRSFLLSRVMLRLALSRRTGRSADSWSFFTSDLGRPMLADGEVDLKFSLSHSGDKVAVALSSELVGIDIEKAGTDPESVACCLSPEERARLRALPAQRRQSEFLSLWTTKEAYSKVLGQGMNRELSEITLDEISRGTHAMQFCLEAHGRYQLTLLAARSGAAVPAFKTHFLNSGSLSLVGAVSAKIPWKPTPSNGVRPGFLRSFVS